MVNPKICSNCSAPLPNNVRFCTKCGTKIEGNTDSAPHQTERASKIEEFPNTNASYQKPQNDPLNDSIESLRESGQDFLRDIGGIFNKVTSNNILSTQYCPKCSAAIPNNVRFCSECGSPVEQSQPIVPDQKPIAEEKLGNDEFDQLQYLEKLAELRDKGIISDEEFEKKKKDILEL